MTDYSHVVYALSAFALIKRMIAESLKAATVGASQIARRK